MHSAQGVGSAMSCPTFSGDRKLTELDQGRLWAALNDNPTRPSRQMLEALGKDGALSAVSVRHLNRLRVKWGLNRGRGRPGGKRAVRMAEPGTAVVKVMPHVTFVGVHLFAAWMESQDGFVRIVALLRQSIECYAQTHPEADFALLHHKEETLLNRFQALFHAPLFGIGKLSELDVIEHPLKSLIGVEYHGSTLSQFLGQLERVGVGEVLLQALIPEKPGKIAYVDGHMIAYWTRQSMHKGKITMLGRIMAGSQAVIAHNQDSHALLVQYYPPDIRMPHFIVEYCQRIVAATEIEVFVIDREVNSVELARKFEASGIGVLSMLDRNEYEDLSSWTVTAIGTLEDGGNVYEGRWAKPREDDPRHFVLVQTADRLLPYWGTSKVKEVLSLLEWPQIYRQRTEIQEYRFKEMKAHGALDVNYGTKKVIGPDRHQQRACEELAQVKANAHQKVCRKEELLKDQQLKVVQSRERDHTTRLEQRQRRLSQLEQEVRKATEREHQLTEKLNALGAPRQRADRDFRKQTIMTLRTLLLENALLAFLAALCANLQEQISLECLLKLLFERSGASMETHCEVTYWVNTTGLSAAYKTTLKNLIVGLSAMNLTSQGKPIRVCLREAPT